MVVGDVHGEFNKLNKLINKKLPKTIIALGDFGYWPKWKSHPIKNRDTLIYWLDGNHEDFWSLEQRESDEIWPGVFYMPRGTIVKLSDGRTALFMGGALSIDKHWRTVGVDWFPEETVKYADVMNLPDVKIDVVFSHTCPKEFLYILLEHNFAKFNDPSYEALSFILDYYKPDLWYFGHWHKYICGKYNNTQWRCLNMAAHSGWWEPLLK